MNMEFYEISNGFKTHLPVLTLVKAGLNKSPHIAGDGGGPCWSRSQWMRTLGGVSDRCRRKYPNTSDARAHAAGRRQRKNRSRPAFPARTRRIKAFHAQGLACSHGVFVVFSLQTTAVSARHFLSFFLVFTLRSCLHAENLKAELCNND